MNVGDRIKKYRKNRGVTADELAEAIGVSRATVFRYEKGDIEKMPATVLEDIAKKLNVTPGTLMGWEEETNEVNKDKEYNFKPNKNIETIAAHIDDDVTEEEMEDIVKYIEFIKSQNKK